MKVPFYLFFPSLPGSFRKTRHLTPLIFSFLSANHTEGSACVWQSATVAGFPSTFIPRVLPTQFTNSSPTPYDLTKFQGRTESEVHPGKAHEGPEREYRYWSTLSLTSALDVGGWLTPRPGRFTPMEETQCPLYKRLGGPAGPVWTGAGSFVRHRDSITGPSNP